MYEWVNTKIQISEIQNNSGIRFPESGSQAVWITKTEGSIKAFLDKCGHMGASISCSNGKFVCPMHGWTYHLDGSNTVPNSPGLFQIQVREDENGFVEVELPQAQQPTFEDEDGYPLPEIKVHSHACLELQYKNHSILFDPWLVSPAYFGSWHLFPKARVSPNELRPDVIVITHPHPDHFHPETLEQFPRDIPIFFPNFSSKFIDTKLLEMGFTNVHAVLFGEEQLVTKGLTFTFLQPQSFWEDSSVFVRAGSWTWLNQNDAGSILDDSLLPNRINLLSTSFDQGASGFPLTWFNLREERKPKLMQLAKSNMLKLLPARARQVNAEHFLPFAGHWRLGLQQHQTYAEMIPHTHLTEVTEAFNIAGVSTKVLELLPGESYSFETAITLNNVAARNEYELGFTSDVHYESDKEHVPDSYNYESFEKYLEELSYNAWAQRCEPVLFRVEIQETGDIFSVDFGEKNDKEQIQIDVEIPRFMASKLIEGDTNWDHLAIGYWGKWSRIPDIYPPNFMRLLQVGNIQLFNEPAYKSGEVILDSSVSDLINLSPDLVSGILSRAGMPCISCSRSNSETLDEAMKIHRISEDWKERTVREISAILGNVQSTVD